MSGCMLKCSMKTTLRKAVVLWHLQRVIRYFSGFFSYEQYIMLINDRHTKNDSENPCFIQNMDFTLYIVKHLQTEYILLSPNFCDYEGFFAELFSKWKDSEIELINKKLVLSLMDSKCDKRILRFFLGLDRSRSEIDVLRFNSPR